MATTTATVVEMRGRPMPGWLRISSDALGDDDLAVWVDRGIGYARSLPPKRLRLAVLAQVVTEIADRLIVI